MVGFAIVLLFSHSTAKTQQSPRIAGWDTYGTADGFTDLLCDWHLSVFPSSSNQSQAEARASPLFSQSQVTGHASQVPQSPLLPACANRAIAGTIRVLDPVTLTGKEGA
jgi:hypothetical protein